MTGSLPSTTTSTPTPRVRRAAHLIALVSAIMHGLLVAFGIFLAGLEDDHQTWWIFTGYCALGLVATLLAWASMRAGRAVWDIGLAVLLVSFGLLAWALTGDGGLGVLSIAISLLFVDFLLFSNTRKALNGP